MGKKVGMGCGRTAAHTKFSNRSLLSVACFIPSCFSQDKKKWVYLT